MSTGVRVPPGFDLRKLLAPLNSTALEHSGEYRRALCRTNPLLFALTYLPHHLRSAETGGEITFSQFHVDIADGARRWVRQDFGPAELREAWIAPRGAAKSTWLFLILPLWALAFGHRRYVQAFADAGHQAKRHLATLKRELEQNEWLRADFPDLCAPESARGKRSTADTAELYVARSGVAMAATGIDSSMLGAKIGQQRPDLLLFDDVEPDASNYSPAAKDKRQGTIINGVLAMNLNAVVQWAGTTTMYGSCTHDLVRTALGEDVAPWVLEQNIRTRYYPAIIEDPDGRERSLWPQRWSLEYLQSIRHTRTYAMNFANRPVSLNGTFWDREDFRYRDDLPVAERVVSVDPAVTAGTTSDYSAIAVVGTDLAHRLAVVEYARQFRVKPEGLRDQVSRILRGNPLCREVIVEVNNGGETWANVLKPGLPPGVKLTLYRSKDAKAVRYAEALDFYQRGWVYHSRPLPAFEDQAVAYPQTAHDDVLDACTAGIAHWLRGRPS